MKSDRNTNVRELKPGDVFRFPWPSGIIHVWLGERWLLTNGVVWLAECVAAAGGVVLLIKGEWE